MKAASGYTRRREMRMDLLKDTKLSWLHSYSQQYGQDYDETFSPVVKFESVRTDIAFAVQMI